MDQKERSVIVLVLKWIRLATPMLVNFITLPHNFLPLLAKLDIWLPLNQKELIYKRQSNNLRIFWIIVIFKRFRHLDQELISKNSIINLEILRSLPALSFQEKWKHQDIIDKCKISPHITNKNHFTCLRIAWKLQMRFWKTKGTFMLDRYRVKLIFIMDIPLCRKIFNKMGRINKE